MKVKKNFSKWWKELKKEVKSHPFIYLTLALVLALGLFIRVYRVGEILGFYFDQGRDALVIWDLWHKGDIPFIGPTTGIAGIFRGAFYYYLIAPFYLIGGGNPIWPSVFLSTTSVLAILIVYYLGYKIRSRTTGLLAAVISSFSFNIVMASRWLSNPAPMLLLSVILVWAMMKVVMGERLAPHSWKSEVGWPVLAFVAGSSLFHFGSSGEAFYFPAIFIFVIWTIRRQGYGGRSSLNNRVVLLTIAAFVITLLPLIAFDIKNNFILTNNVKNFLFSKESFGFPTWGNIGDKIEFIYNVFTNKIFNGRNVEENVLLSFIALSFVYFLHKLVKNKGVMILLLLLATGSLGIILFQGNFGNIYDYYLTGYYLPFILLFSVALTSLWEIKLGKVFVLYFIYFFLVSNADVLEFKLGDRGDGPNSVAFVTQKKSIDWIYADAKGREFNVDVYVPPVIPHAYDYLFKWYGGSSHGREPKEELIPLLYTLYEVDPPHPDRLQVWLERQEGIGKVEEETRFGGITVQRRTRL